MMTLEVAKKELTLCVLIWDSSQDALKQDAGRGLIVLPFVCTFKEGYI